MKRAALFVVLLTGALIAYVASTAANAEALSRFMDGVKHPEWSYNASIYEVNLRQYSPGGTLVEFESHLERLRDMGIGILWFMPVHPIGEKNRKGSLGSYYSVRDYYAVNPEFGTLDEFKVLVAKTHDMGMYVIIDWVGNHSAWDNPLAVEHPDWYIRDQHGIFRPPVPDWSDVIAFDYRNPELRRYMIDAMKFWVRDVGVDGFRCDVAGMVPLDFWETARLELEEVKPVFILAEWESPAAHNRAFDMTYSWDLYRAMNDIAQNKATASAVDSYLQREAGSYPRHAFRMLFTSNHDENSWNGTVFERLGGGVGTFAVLSATLPGMPLVYSGQEAALSKRLEFFEKDQIPWGDYRFQWLYSALLNLKRRNRALWNGEAGGEVERVYTSNDQSVFAFLRAKHDNRVFVILNLSNYEETVTLPGDTYSGHYRDLFSGESISLEEDASLNLEAWGYRVYEGLEQETGSDIDLLKSFMVGSFSSYQQAAADSDYLDIRLEVVPIWTESKDGYWLYVEQAVAAHRHRPYRQRVYHLIEDGEGNLRSEAYSFADPLRFAGDWIRDDPLAALTPDSLYIRGGCAVVLMRTSPDMFEGSTVERQCESDLRGASYATSEVTITRDRMMSWDRGFDSSGNQVWGATKGPYVFDKLQ